MNKKNKFFISGIHCKSCKTLIETELKNTKGIKMIEVDHQTGAAQVEFDDSKINLKKIFEKVESLNYQIEQTSKKEKNLKPLRSYKLGFLVLLAVIILGGGYWLVESLGGFELLAQLNENHVSYSLILIIGLLAGFHCVGMCGGLVVAYSVKTKERNDKFRPHLEYNLGRIISYTTIGGILGGLGSFFGINPLFTGTIIILASIFMILMGLSFLTGWSILEKIKLRTPAFIARFIYSQKHQKKPKGPFLIGLLNGFMPCGPLQAIQLYALTSGDVVRGALSLGTYAFGTAIMMFIFGLTVSSISNQNIKKMVKLSGVLVIVLGLFMANRGLANFGYGFIPAHSANQVTTTGESNKNFQEVRMKLTYLGYQPSVLYIKPDLPVRWIIDVEQMSGCTDAIMIESLGINRDLKYGENIIEFTPPKNIEEIKFSCWMRMVWGKFIITNDTNNQNNTQQTIDTPPTGGSCNGSCGRSTYGAAQGGTCGCGG